MNRRQFLTSGAAAASFLSANRTISSAAQGNSAKAAGFYLPEETIAHERTFMQWPVNKTVHPDSVFLDLLQRTIADLANSIVDFEPVIMLMDKGFETAARKMLSAKVEIWDIATDDLWCRDSGPAFVIDGKGAIATTAFNFNGWGGKQVHDNDAQVARRVAERLGLQVFNNGLVGEPGGVESNGAGVLIAHESSWVEPGRNKGTRDEVEALLLDALGAKEMVWAPGVQGADITDYHIDSLARFVTPELVLMQLPETSDPSDPWNKAAFETYDILEKQDLAGGAHLSLMIVPEPVDTRVKADDFVASYVNYYVCNGAVISAQFGDEETDVEALATLKGLYPGREVITLNVDPLGEIGGGIHCATHEQPKV